MKHFIIIHRNLVFVKGRLAVKSAKLSFICGEGGDLNLSSSMEMEWTREVLVTGGIGNTKMMEAFEVTPETFDQVINSYPDLRFVYEEVKDEFAAIRKQAYAAGRTS